MKISKSKQELARIISENGGWPDSAEYSAQDGGDGQVSFYKAGLPAYNKESKTWDAPGSCVHIYKSRIIGGGIIKNFHQTILSRAEFFHLYPAPDADGWIEWNGGECPAPKEVLVVVKMRDGELWSGGDPRPAGRLGWGHVDDISDIIAYRLHKQEQAKSVGASAIGVTDSRAEAKPSIEKLTSSYRNAKDYAERKQQEADAAKADADSKLAELVAAGRAIGLDVSPVAAPVEPELVINDWRDLQVGDEIEVTSVHSKSNSKYALVIGRPSKVVCVGDPGWQMLRVKTDVGNEELLIDGFKFIRRP